MMTGVAFSSPRCKIHSTALRARVMEVVHASSVPGHGNDIVWEVVVGGHTVHVKGSTEIIEIIIVTIIANEVVVESVIIAEEENEAVRTNTTMIATNTAIQNHVAKDHLETIWTEAPPEEESAASIVKRIESGNGPGIDVLLLSLSIVSIH